MKVGAWFHGHNDIPLQVQIEQAASNGLTTVRSYEIGYSEKVAPVLQKAGMSLLAGMHIKDKALLAGWQSQVRVDELARYHELGIPLEVICVGNELRENGTDPRKKRFTARLSFGLANVLSTYRHWLDDHGFQTPLTYAMEGIVFDREGNFNDWLWPLIDVCDIVSLNLYPMNFAAWYTFGAFEESRLFLHDNRIRNERLLLFELRLRRVLDQLKEAGKRLILSETGFPSAVGYLRDENHAKITRERSPIHVAFGLCNRSGTPKLNLKQLMRNLAAI